MPSHWRAGHRLYNDPPGASGAAAGESTGDQVDDANLSASQLEPPVVAASNIERPPECINRYPTPAFSLLCTMMDRLRSEEANKRRDTLTRFMSLWRIKVGNDLYPLIRLLLPDVSRLLQCESTHSQRDRERPVYNLKEAMLAKCYIEVLGLDKHSDAAQRLIKWKQPIEGQVRGIGLVETSLIFSRNLTLETLLGYAIMRLRRDRP